MDPVRAARFSRLRSFRTFRLRYCFRQSLIQQASKSLRYHFHFIQRQTTMNRLAVVLFSTVVVLQVVVASAQERSVSAGLALTPPMGWNTWNKFGCNVSDELVRGMADAMVKSGMKDAGYQYVVIDDCWQVSRDEHANIVPDPQRFPNGIKAVADYVHSLGLKFGIYSD